MAWEYKVESYRSLEELKDIFQWYNDFNEELVKNLPEDSEEQGWEYNGNPSFSIHVPERIEMGPDVETVNPLIFRRWVVKSARPEPKEDPPEKACPKCGCTDFTKADMMGTSVLVCNRCGYNCGEEE